jgi:hypothetical protein
LLARRGVEQQLGRKNSSYSSFLPQKDIQLLISTVQGGDLLSSLKKPENGEGWKGFRYSLLLFDVDLFVCEKFSS